MNDPNGNFGTQPPVDPYDFPKAEAVPPPKPKMDVEMAPIKRLYRAKAMLGEQYWLFFGIAIVGLLIGGVVPFYILMGPMICGMFICYRQRMHGHQSSFDPLFKGFKFFGESVIPTLIHFGLVFLIIFALSLVFGAVMVAASVYAEANDATGIIVVAMLGGYFLFLILIMALAAALYVPFTFVYPLIVDRGMSGMDATKESWRMAKLHFSKLFKMYLVYMVIYFAASMACIIPAYLLMPLLIGAIFTLYEDFYGLNPTPPPIEGIS